MAQHILFATEANEGLGHIAPWKALITQLLRKGDYVTFARPQPDIAQSVLNLPNLNHQAILWPSMHAGATPAIANSWGELLMSLGYASHKAVQACLQRWLQLLRQIQPSWVIADYAPLAMLAAKSLGLPIIEAGGGFCLPPSDYKLGLLLPTAVKQSNTAKQDILAKAQLASWQVALACNAALQFQSSTLRLEKLTDLYTLSNHRCVTSSPELDPYCAAMGVRNDVIHIGPLAPNGTGRLAQDIAPAWAQGPTPVPANAPPQQPTRILCYLKSNTPELQQIKQVLQQLPACQVIAAGWPADDPQPKLQLTPSHVHLVSDAVDFESALPLADVFITNGGLHSLSWALHHQCQCILLPTQAEQAATALHLAGHPQVTVCVDAKSLGLALKQMGKKQSSPALGKLAAGDNAEAILFRIIQRDITHVNTRQINHAIEY